MHLCIYIFEPQRVIQAPESRTYVCIFIYSYIYVFAYFYIFTYSYIYIFTYLHIYTHTHKHTHTYRHTPIHICNHLIKHTYTHTHAIAHTLKHTHTHRRMKHGSRAIHTHVYRHTHIHTYTHIHIYTHIHTYTPLVTHLNTHTHIDASNMAQEPQRVIKALKHRTRQIRKVLSNRLRASTQQHSRSSTIRGHSKRRVLVLQGKIHTSGRCASR